MTRTGRVASKDVVRDHIRAQLFRGALRGGDRIDQDAIASELGISRIPIREALISLAHEGLVTQEISRGTYVSTFDASTLREHFEIYGVLSGLATARIARDPSPVLLSELRSILNRIAKSDDPATVDDLTKSFRRLLHANGAGTRLRNVLSSLDGYVIEGFYAVEGALETNVRGLRRELAALRAGDPVRAAAATLRFSRESGEVLISSLRESGRFGAVGEGLGPRRRAALKL